MSKKETGLMYSEHEIEILKKTFSENDELLIAIRKLFFGDVISDSEKEAIIATFKDKPEVIDAFRKKVYGVNNFNTPVGQLSDFWLGAEKQIFGASRDTVYQAIESKKLVLSMFIKAFKLLENPDGEKVSLEFNSTMTDELGVSLIARNMYMQSIETALLTIKIIAGQKDETPAQAVKRLQQDSAK